MIRWQACLLIKKPKVIVTELFLCGRNVNVLLFSSLSHTFLFQKLLEYTQLHYFFMKIQNKYELKPI